MPEQPDGTPEPPVVPEQPRLDRPTEPVGDAQILASDPVAREADPAADPIDAVGAGVEPPVDAPADAPADAPVDVAAVAPTPSDPVPGPPVVASVAPALLAPALVALARLALIGFGVGTCVGLLTVAGDLSPFLVNNFLGGKARAHLVRCVVLGPGLGIFAGVLALIVARVRRRISVHARIEALDALARRLVPLALLCFLPLLFRWRTWEGRDLTFVVLVLMFGFAAERAVAMSLAAPPVLGRIGVALSARWARVSAILLRYPLLWVLLGIAIYVTFFSVATIRYHRFIYSASFDLGLEENILWNIVHGGYFYKSTPLLGPDGTSFGLHATLFSYPLAGLYALWPRTETVLIAQAAFMGGAALPLFLLGRRKLGGPAAAVVALCYLLYPPLHGAALYDFHYPPLAPFFMWMSLFLVESRRYWLAVPFVLLTLSVREDISAGIAIMGAYLALTGERPRAGLLLAGVGALWFLILKLIVMPRFAGHEAFLYMFQGLVPKGGKGFSDVIKTVVANPSFTLGTLLTADKLIYVLLIFGPLLFLPLRRPIGLLLILPGFVFTLLSIGYLPLIQISFQYTTHWTMYVFVGLIAALAWIGQRSGEVARRAALAGLLCAAIPCSYQFGGLLQQHTVKGGFGTYKFNFSVDDERRRDAFHQLAVKVPRKARITSAENLVPHFAQRKKAYTLRVGIFDADYIMFTVYPHPLETPILKPALEGDFGIMEINEHFGLAKRGHDKSLNAEYLKKI